MENLYHVQYTDKNASVKDYQHLAADEILVKSIFPTLQGEGPYAGHPALFIRLAGCNRGDKANMGCDFCDTDFRLSEGKIYKIDQLVFQATAQAKLIVLTGGEPTLQDNIVPLIKALHDKGKIIQIESNGDRLPKDYDKNLATLVVSPKITPSTQAYKALRQDVWDALSCLKFVVEFRYSSPYHSIPIWAYQRDPGEVYISPLAVYKRAVAAGEVASFWKDDLLDKQAMANNYAYAGWLCKQNRFRLSIQSHLLVAIE